MDYELHKNYEAISLTIDLRKMFGDIVMTDETTRKVFMTIAKLTHNEVLGLTIKQIIDQVMVDRKALSSDGSTFKKVHTNIDRKQAEKTVDKLLGMSLCYSINVHPSKLINLTIRGKEVAADIASRIRQSTKQGDE